MSKIAYTAAQVFTGTDMLRNHAVIASDNIIESVMPIVSVDDGVEIVNFGEDAVIAPPFLDIQLYGAAGRLLSVYPDAATVQAIVDYSKEGGAAYCIPTVATNSYEVIFACVDAIKAYWNQGGKGALGLHVEGPWINPVKRGAHIEQYIFSPTVEQVKELLEYGRDVIKIITLAPEVCSREIVALIRSYNIVVSAGHSNATYHEACDMFTSGIETATHLYNAMSPLQHREPGLVGAIFNHNTIKCSIVPDGFHVDFAAISIAKKIMKDRLFIITDAVTTTTEGPYQHYLAGDKYEANGILSGSALTMAKGLKNLVEKVHIDLPEALRMCSLYQGKLLSLTDEKLLLKAGYPAEMVVLNKDLGVERLIVA
ncbi:N-acetylglucosamine-6-phosphate deacetylase [Deminuibacter soli]|uniref:N-acetylglucosamine-6-phosphate deacetylase n=1 Tax=Deminuibacter soli TaxID=2291815 RepID=A0A3E1NQU3_9BACT|nr:N-acetylglucosamine-6-phosphate deacetylase [Deminuibacter soli]RFM30277.1 N-acetylglucosamine-6-phosphate deacetylase [Deminuibacter soli]